MPYWLPEVDSQGELLVACGSIFLGEVRKQHSLTFDLNDSFDSQGVRAETTVSVAQFASRAANQ